MGESSRSTSPASGRKETASTARRSPSTASPLRPAALGWAQQLAGYPPLLSHNELEHALDREQSKLYDALAGILGLGELADGAAGAAEGAAQLASTMPRTRAKRCRRCGRSSTAPPTNEPRWCAPRSQRRRGISTLLRAQSAATRRAMSAASFASCAISPGLPVLDREQLNAATTELRDAHAAAERLRGTDAGERTRWRNSCSRRLMCMRMRTTRLSGLRNRRRAHVPVARPGPRRGDRASSRCRRRAERARDAGERDTTGPTAGHRSARGTARRRGRGCRYRPRRSPSGSAGQMLLPMMTLSRWPVISRCTGRR